MQHFMKRRLISILCASGAFIMPPSLFASAFQLWEQDGATIGHYHAGYAALANDASTAFYNPAGITRIKNQQLVLGGLGVVTDFKYRGSVTISESPFGFPVSSLPSNVTAQGGNFSFVPSLHFVAPITDKIGFGFSVDAPFGLKTDFGKETALRYAATRTSITVIDISPSLGWQITDTASLGAGLDVQKTSAEFNSVGVFLISPNPAAFAITDTPSINYVTGTGYGYHLGGLYQFTPNSRVGISYHSQVVQHLSGTSKFAGFIPYTLNHGNPTVYSQRATVNITLPPYTAFSVYHRVHPKVALMASAIYTQWHTFKSLVLHNVAGAIAPPIATSNTIQVTVPQNYRNTWNFSIGADFSATEQITLRSGLGYDQTPVRNADRNVQLPDNNRYIIALGGHYQATPKVGIDVGWAHLFINETKVSPPPQVMGGQTVKTNGTVHGGADVYGGQVTWDII